MFSSKPLILETFLNLKLRGCGCASLIPAECAFDAATIVILDFLNSSERLTQTIKFYCDATKSSSIVYSVYEANPPRRSVLPNATMAYLDKAQPSERSWLYCFVTCKISLAYLGCTVDPRPAKNTFIAAFHKWSSLARTQALVLYMLRLQHLCTRWKA